eukprot:3771035-Pleurochrysis_carterae.AAC.1
MESVRHGACVPTACVRASCVRTACVRAACFGALCRRAAHRHAAQWRAVRRFKIGVRCASKTFASTCLYFKRAKSS